MRGEKLIKSVVAAQEHFGRFSRETFELADEMCLIGESAIDGERSPTWGRSASCELQQILESHRAQERLRTHSDLSHELSLELPLAPSDPFADSSHSGSRLIALDDANRFFQSIVKIVA